MTRRLFDRGPRRRRVGGTALVHVPEGVCPACGDPTSSMEWTQPPLLRHGGHGEALRRTRESCRCGWSIDRASDSIHPGPKP